MSKEIQIRDGNLIASFDLENEDGDIDFCKLLKVSHGVAKEIGMFVDYIATNKIIKDQSNKITDLEAKLAEKEGEIEDLKAQRRIYLNRSVEECNKITDLEFELQHKHQDKISFALEQLKKVKENIKKVPITDFDLSGNFEKMYKQDAIRQIDNQIKQLKGENQ